MPPGIATVVFALGILVMFTLDRDRDGRTSKALWIPVVWMLIAGSRAVSQWLGFAPVIETADQALDGSPLDRNVLTGLITAGLLVLAGRGREVGRLLRANGIIVAFFCYCALSVFWSDFPEVAAKRVMRAVGDLVMILVVLTDPDPPLAIRRFLTRVSFVLIPASILLIKYYPHLGQSWSAGRTFFTGVTVNKNMFGIIVMIAGLTSLWRLITLCRSQTGAPRTGPLIAHGALFLIIVALFVRIDSMTSLACFGLAASVMVSTSFPGLVRNRTVVHLLVASVLCFALSTLFLGVGTDLVGTMGRDSTLTGRTDLWKDLVNLNDHPLLGSGFESFWAGRRLEVLWEMYVWRPNEAHNGYLEVFLNLGWVGVTLFGVVIATGYRNVMQMLYQEPEIGKLKLALVVCGLAYGFTEAAFRMMSPVWISFVLAMFAVPEFASPQAYAVRHHRYFSFRDGDRVGRFSRSRFRSNP
jgi:exopolysaccharide production protein ExoQ